jgi:hypothetical protein
MTREMRILTEAVAIVPEGTLSTPLSETTTLSSYFGHAFTPQETTDTSEICPVVGLIVNIEDPLQGLPEQVPPSEYDKKSFGTNPESGSDAKRLIKGPYGPGLLAGAINAVNGFMAFRINVVLNIGGRLICAKVTVTESVADNFVS